MNIPSSLVYRRPTQVSDQDIILLSSLNRVKFHSIMTTFCTFFPYYPRLTIIFLTNFRNSHHPHIYPPYLQGFQDLVDCRIFIPSAHESNLVALWRNEVINAKSFRRVGRFCGVTAHSGEHFATARQHKLHYHRPPLQREMACSNPEVSADGGMIPKRGEDERSSVCKFSPGNDVHHPTLILDKDP